MKKSERILFILGWIGIGLCIVAGLFIHFGFLDFIHGIELCYFHRVTGLYCPGCGMTRAVFELVSGHPLRSLGKNIGLLGFGGIYAAFMVGCIYKITALNRLRRSKKAFQTDKCQTDILQEKENLLIKRSRLYNKRLEVAIIIMSGLFILQWLLKNLLLIFRNIDLLMK